MERATMTQSQAAPSAIGSPPGTFRLALDALRAAKASSVLDCPAGEGPFARMLLDAGFETSCCDIDPDQFKVPKLVCTHGDLNGTLPYDDEQFDAVTCLNGLQRVWARGHALREFSRILKVGGTLVVSYPNQGDMRRRMLNLISGSVTWNVIGPPHVCTPDAAAPASTFRYAMTTANVLSGFESVGLETQWVRSTHYSVGALAMAPIALIPKFAAWFASARLKQSYYLRESATNDALFGAFLVAVAKKPVS
jgi:SAM-dependent methyltransferase